MNPTEAAINALHEWLAASSPQLTCPLPKLLFFVLLMMQGPLLCGEPSAVATSDTRRAHAGCKQRLAFSTCLLYAMASIATTSQPALANTPVCQPMFAPISRKVPRDGISAGTPAQVA
eukprot:CAMPEP_0119386494 /NCGR_PEP_ID=MMETSP1334-20130426/96252_1 /TAXON_ID=127549 /ORGANISM="Calcidiscus leptoporus, Strain RCC1130" /LENGTH=117 /DNA_ID=CAMNT_0007408007 /DNA_START=212 /DNA_END=566 /DNA_ORIENTATION=+